MGMDVGSNRGAIRSDINITPLVDVVLVLLIIFMVITPMLQRGKAVELPKAVTAAAGPPSPEPKFVSVDKDGKIYVEKEEVTLDQLKDQLFAINAQGVRVMLKADKDTEYRFIRPVLDKASKAKMTRIALAAEQLKVK
jgi:biopolymer transport protein ExbD/biopolymer transport protein TolR